MTQANDPLDGLNIIDERDAQIMGMLGTRDGMRLAFGILWSTWGDKNTAASIARHVLSAELWANAEMTLEAYGGGRVEMACEEFKPLHEADFNDYKGENRDQ